MILLYVAALMVSAAIYVATKPLRQPIRVLTAFAIFVLLSAGITMWFRSLSDEPAEGTYRVTPEEVGNPE
jgi:hypothetical protein